MPSPTKKQTPRRSHSAAAHRCIAILFAIVLVAWFRWFKEPVQLLPALNPELPLDDALELAKATDRPVILYFRDGRYGNCLGLDQELWADERVTRWLQTETVSLSLEDHEHRTALQRFYAHSALCTIVVLSPDGTLLDSLAGLRTPDTFLREARDALAGHSTVVRAREELMAAPEQVDARLKLADALEAHGNYTAALDELLVVLDFMLSASRLDRRRNEIPRFGGSDPLRRVAGRVSRLGNSHPPAIAALRHRRAVAREGLMTLTVAPERRDQHVVSFARHQIDNLLELDRALWESICTLEFFEELLAAGMPVAAFDRGAVHAGKSLMQNVGWSELPQFNPEAAMRWYRLAASAGNVVGIYGVGDVYADRRAADYSPELALTWLDRAARSGDIKAMYRLGVSHRYGTVGRFSRLDPDHAIDPDARLAAYWIRKAADAGLTNAMVDYGWFLQRGLGVLADHQGAIIWYERAVKTGWVPDWRLGWLYENGRGVVKDSAKAVPYYRLAADAGEKWSAKRLVTMYDRGIGVSRDEKEATYWRLQLARKGDRAAMERLAEQYESGIGVTADRVEAKKWWDKLAALEPPPIPPAEGKAVVFDILAHWLALEQGLDRSAQPEPARRDPFAPPDSRELSTAGALRVPMKTVRVRASTRNERRKKQPIAWSEWPERDPFVRPDLDHPPTETRFRGAWPGSANINETRLIAIVDRPEGLIAILKEGWEFEMAVGDVIWDAELVGIDAMSQCLQLKLWFPPYMSGTYFRYLCLPGHFPPPDAYDRRIRTEKFYDEWAPSDG